MDMKTLERAHQESIATTIGDSLQNCQQLCSPVRGHDLTTNEILMFEHSHHRFLQGPRDVFQMLISDSPRAHINISQLQPVTSDIAKNFGA
eukprot:767111-Hanusia_phi.AAC.2